MIQNSGKAQSNHQAEKLFISAILMFGENPRDLDVNLQVEDFTNIQHQLMYQAILKIISRDESPEFVTVRNELDEMGVLRHKVSDDYLKEVAFSVNTSVHMSQHARIVKEKSYLSGVYTYGQKLLNTVSFGVDRVNELLANPPSYDSQSPDHRATHELLDKNLKVIKERKESGDSIRGTPTGYDDLDRLTGGLKGAEIIGLYGEANSGKSLLASSIGQNIVKHSGTIAYFSYEMLSSDLSYRMLPSLTGVPVGRFNTSDLSVAELNDFTEAIGSDKIKRFRIFAEELKRWDSDEVDRKVRSMNGVDFVVIDYLHLMKPLHKAQNDFDGYTQILRELKSVALRNKVPMLILLSQNKNGDLRGTEELRHAFDQLWQLVKVKEQNSVHRYTQARIDVLKGRNNEKGSIPLLFDRDLLTFISVEQ